MAEKLNAVSARQPSAYWLATGVKTVLNTSWAPPPWLIGKPVAIHAPKNYDADAEAWIRARFPALSWPISDYRRLGLIVGVATLAAIIAPRHSQSLVTAPRAESYDQLLKAGTVTKDDWQWWSGEYGWVLRDAVKLPSPVKCDGSRMLWTVHPDVLPHVRDQFAAGRRVKEARRA